MPDRSPSETLDEAWPSIDSRPRIFCMASSAINESGVSPNRAWVPALWLGLLLLLCYHIVLARLVEQWIENEDMSHGPFVPLVVGYIVWQRRSELAALPAKPSLAGLGLMLLGMFMLCVGPPSLPTFTLVTRLAFFASLVGTILFVRGMPTLRRLSYPLLLLVMMIPIPAFLYEKITLPLQFVASVVAERLLELAGYSVFREGNILNLPGQVLSVAEACSGLRSLLSLTFLGQAYIYFMDPRVWMRWVIAVAVIPIAVISNAGRIVLTAWLGSINREWTEGVVHDWTGWTVFAIAFAAILLTHYSANAVSRRFQN